MPKYELVITNDNELSPLKSTPLTLSVLELIGPQGIQGPEGPRGVIGVTNTGGDGSLEYDPITGIFTYTGPSADEVRGHFSSGTGVTITDGQISIGQSVATTDNVTFNNVTSNLTGDVTGTVSTLTNHTTDDLAEGTTNLYYTSARANTDFDTRLAAKTTSDLTEGTNLYYTTARFDTAFGAKDTDNLSEGTTNLYYTDGRAQAAISTDSTLSYSSGVVGMPNTGVTAAEYGSASQVPVITVDAQGRITSASETNVAGVTGFDYDTLTGVLDIDTADGGNFEATVTLDPFDTDDLSEGTDNLYYTDSRSRAAISVTEAGGDGSLAYNNTTGIITFTGPSADEVRDHFIAGDGVTITNGEIAIGQAVGTANSPQFTGLTLTGDLTVNGSTTTINTTNLAVQDSLIELSSGLTAAAGNDAGLIIERGTTGDNAFIGWDEAANKFTLGTTTATGTSTGSLAVTTGTLVADIEGDVTGNSDTASTLATARTISLDGDVSGSVSFDGSQNVTLTATVADDSHNHTIANIDNLQTALDAKQNASNALIDSDIGSTVQAHDALLDAVNQDVSSGSNVTFGTITAGTFSFANWTVTESGGSLYFATGGSNKMKLDASGNLQVVGNVESNATIS